MRIIVYVRVSLKGQSIYTKPQATTIMWPRGREKNEKLSKNEEREEKRKREGEREGGRRVVSRPRRLLFPFSPRGS